MSHRDSGPRLAPWAEGIGPPVPEPTRSKALARTGGAVSILALAAYVTWRVAFTLPAGSWNRAVALCLISFEFIPIFGLTLKLVTLWRIDCTVPVPLATGAPYPKVAVLIPTYNEPAEVIVPTIAASIALAPAHETWVLDDGDRGWVEDVCHELGARYVSRPVHDHAKAGNLNHALALMAAEESAAGVEPTAIVAVLDCDHVPLPQFLTSTLPWFEDPGIALVQCPQDFYNLGAFDDDGNTGEQGLFFNVLMPARQAGGAGPFWCGSTALVRVDALASVGGVATETITEDMHTTLKLLREGWRTAYHDQTVAVGLAPATPDEYLVQRRRWGLGAMQVLVREKLWAAKRWMSWRSYWEYLDGTVFWLEGVATVLAFCVPVAVMVSGAQTSTAPPLHFLVAFGSMFVLRLWGAKRLMRGHIRWSTAFALRTLRIPVGLACVQWLVTRTSLDFRVTPKGGADERRTGRPPRIIVGLAVTAFAICGYAAMGVAGWVPWYATPSSTIASGLWLALAGSVLLFGIARIRAERYASSRRRAYRFPVTAAIAVDDVPARLLDVSVTGVSAQLPAGASAPSGLALVRFPGDVLVKMEQVRTVATDAGGTISLRVPPGDWRSLAAISRWLFHTPAGAVAGLPDGYPAVARRG